jgi:hypothetical protein
MGAVTTLIDTVVAKAPCPFITNVAPPITGICKREADLTKHPRLETMGWIFRCHEALRSSRRFLGDFGRWPISVSSKSVWKFVLRGISLIRFLLLIVHP